MAGLDASGVARLLEEFGQRLELSGENPYKARAYSNAAKSLRGLTKPLADLIANGQLRDIPGVGPTIAERIRALHETGTHPALEALREDIPADVLEMLKIPGLRAREVVQIHKQLGITTLEELEAACRLNFLKERKGFGAALQDRILQGLDMMRRSRGQRLLHSAHERLRKAAVHLSDSRRDLGRIEPAGEYRRGCEVVAD